MDYDKMLKRAVELVPKDSLKAERFEIPKVRGHIQGNKTVVTNLVQIANTLTRKPEHLLKYILKELATPGDFKKNTVMFGRKISATSINEKITNYARVFVICPECGKPDTKLAKEKTLWFIKCLACGAKRAIKAKI